MIKVNIELSIALEQVVFGFILLELVLAVELVCDFALRLDLFALLRVSLEIAIKVGRYLLIVYEDELVDRDDGGELANLVVQDVVQFQRERLR